MLALWLFIAAYAVLYGAFGLRFFTFLPPLLGERGLRPEDVGLVLAGAMAVRVFAGPILPMPPIVFHRHTVILSGCALLAAAATAAFLLPRQLCGRIRCRASPCRNAGPSRRSWTSLGDGGGAQPGPAALPIRLAPGRRIRAFAVGNLASGWLSAVVGLAKRCRPVPAC